MLDDENLFFYTYFHAIHTHPTAKFLKLYVRVVNSIHFMQNGDENRVEISDKYDKYEISRALAPRGRDAPAPCRSTRQ
jgi:hypothetical protein